MKREYCLSLWVIYIPVILASCKASSQTNFWQQVGAPYNGDVRSMTFTGSGVMLGGTYGGGVWRSTNDGQSWSMSNTGIGDYYIYGLATSPNGNVFATVSWGVCRSSNEGVNWEPVLVSSSQFRCLAISKAVQSSGTIFAGSTNGVTRSTDNGTSWSSFQMTNVAPILALAVGPTGIVYAASTSYGVYRSTDNGATWVQTSLLLGTFVSLAANSSGHIFAATYANVHRTLDSGATWQQVVITSSDVKSVSVALNGHIFAALATVGVYRSTNNGTIWDSVNTGLTNRYGALLGVSPSGYVFAVAGAHMFRSAGFVTAVYLPPPSLPASVTLHQNYPNPFNPTTRIEYQLPTNAFVITKVFDILGKEVKSLVNEQQSAGLYHVDLDGTNMPSGAYVCRIQAGSFVVAKKLLLLR